MTFLAPMFLFAGIALLAPIILHLLRRQVARNLVFPSVRFILKGKLPRAGRRRLRDVSLLIVRCLLFAALVLLFARPALRTPAESSAMATAAKSRPEIIFLDLSASMATKGRLDAAKTAITQRMRRNPSARRGLVLSPGDGEGDVGFAAADSAILDVVESVAARPFKGRHAEAMARLELLIEEEPRALVCVVSDFQHTDWASSRLSALPPDVDYELVNVAEGDVENLGVTNVHCRRLSNGDVRLMAEIRNFGNVSMAATAAFRVGAETVKRSVNVPPRSLRKVAALLSKPETMIGSVQLAEDDYPLDDVFHVWLGGPPPARVLLAAPFSQEPRKRNEVFFVAKALKVESSRSSRGFQVETVDSEYFSALPLERVDALFLPDSCGYFEDNDFRRLRDFLRNGGVVLCTPGDAVGRQFLSLRRHGLLDVDYLGLERPERVGESPTGLAWFDPKSFLADLFDNPEEGDLFTFPIRRFAKITTHASVETLLKMDHDWPALVRVRVGEGTLYATTFAFAPSWSDLPLSNSFLPLVRELFLAALPADGGAVKIECGTAVPETLAEEASTPLDVRRPGVTVINDRALQVNVSRDESVIDRQPLAAVRATLSPRDSAPPAATASKPSVTMAESMSLWPTLAVVAALLFLVELVLARSAGIGSSSRPR